MEPEALNFCFDIVAAGTLARGAEFVIERVGLRAAAARATRNSTRPISRRPGIPGSPGAAAGPIRFLDRPFESRRRGVVRGWEPIQTEWRPLADDWPARSP